MDSHPHAQGEGGLALGDVVVADAVGAVGGDAELRVEPVEGLLGGPLAGRVGVGQVVGQVGVVVGPGAHRGVVGGQVRDGVAVGPVVGIGRARLGLGPWMGT